MVKKLQEPPFPPVISFDTDDLFTINNLRQMLAENPGGVSLCLRYANGDEARGGYFFHFKVSDEDENNLSLFDFSNEKIADLEESQLVALINHCSGRQFDKVSFDFCQAIVNLRTD